MKNWKYFGSGEIHIDKNRGEVIVKLPEDLKVILEHFWETKKCKVYYDRISNSIHIFPENESLDAISRKLTLHEAIALVIYQNGNKPMKPPEILEEIKKKNLYRKKDGNFPEIQQIHARITKYSGKLFKRVEEGVVLTEECVKFVESELIQSNV